MQPSTSHGTKKQAHSGAQAKYRNSTAESPLLEITRSFDVPVSRLFSAFKTEADVLRWFWPKDLYTDRVEIDFRVGGKYFFNMKGYDRGGGGATGRYVEIVEDELIVMTDHFSDENGNKISAKEAKMSGPWPGTVFISFDFKPIGDQASEVHLAQEGIPAEMQKECIQGWNQAFDKLETLFNSEA